jgi:hypothetical protein
MTPKFHYDDSIEAKSVAIQSAEVAALIENGGSVFAKKPARIIHFLYRVAATLGGLQATINRLHANISSLQTSKIDGQQPVQRAIDAISQLNETEIKEVLDISYLDHRAKLTKAEQLAELTQLGSKNEANRIRLILSALMEDPQLPDLSKQAIKAALAQIDYYL